MRGDKCKIILLIKQGKFDRRPDRRRRRIQSAVWRLPWWKTTSNILKLNEPITRLYRWRNGDTQYPLPYWIKKEKNGLSVPIKFFTRTVSSGIKKCVRIWIFFHSLPIFSVPNVISIMSYGAMKYPYNCFRVLRRGWNRVVKLLYYNIKIMVAVKQKTKKGYQHLGSQNLVQIPQCH